MLDLSAVEGFVLSFACLFNCSDFFFHFAPGRSKRVGRAVVRWRVGGDFPVLNCSIIIPCSALAFAHNVPHRNNNIINNSKQKCLASNKKWKSDQGYVLAILMPQQFSSSKLQLHVACVKLFNTFNYRKDPRGHVPMGFQSMQNRWKLELLLFSVKLFVFHPAEWDFALMTSIKYSHDSVSLCA